MSSEVNWQTRVRFELKGLTDRLNKLTEFLEGGEAFLLPEEDIWLLNQQKLVMDLYRKILKRQISRFKE